jgi:predicted molibdopterin-dependent oxidoreductase YjgC
VAWRSVRHEPGDAPRVIGATVAEPDVAEQFAKGNVVVVAGRANLAESQETATASLAALLAAVPSAKVLPALRRGNVVGALALGLDPAVGDGTDGGHDDGLSVLRSAAEGKLDLLVLLGADPVDDCPDADLARRAMAGARRVLAIDAFVTESNAHADVVLAAAAYGEKSGTTTNLEGRVTTVAQKITAAGTARPDWMIAVELAMELGHDLGFGSVTDITDAIAAGVPAYAGITTAALARHRDGIVTAISPAALPDVTTSARDRITYDYRLVVSRKLYDNAVGTSRSPSLAALAPGAAAHVHPLDFDQTGVAAGADVRIVSARGSVVLPLVANPAVPRATVWAPFNQTGPDIREVMDSTVPVTDVRIERL